MVFENIRSSVYQNEDIRGSGEAEDQIRKSDKNAIVIPRHERLWVWRRSHNLMLTIHNICKKLPREEIFKLCDQIQRSSKAVPDNIAEGNSSYYFNNKIKSYYVSRKEAAETQNHLREMEGKKYIDKSVSQSMINEYEEIIRGINGLINKTCKLKEFYNTKGIRRT